MVTISLMASTLDMGDQRGVRPRERVTVPPSRQWEAARQSGPTEELHLHKASTQAQQVEAR